MSDPVLKDIKEAFRDLEQDFESKENSKKGPGKLILSLFIIFIFFFSFIPYYSLKLDPHPDLQVIEDFKLTSQEKELFRDNIAHFSSVKQAANKVDPSLYRPFTTRLVTTACPFKSKTCYAKAIYLYVRDNIYYVSDPDFEYVQNPAETLTSGGDDCDGKALLLATMLESIGIDADIGLTFSHAFVRAQIPEALTKYKHQGSDYVWLDSTSHFSFGSHNIKDSEIRGFIEI